MRVGHVVVVALRAAGHEYLIAVHVAVVARVRLHHAAGEHIGQAVAGHYRRRRVAVLAPAGEGEHVAVHARLGYRRHRAVDAVYRQQSPAVADVLARSGDARAHRVLAGFALRLAGYRAVVRAQRILALKESAVHHVVEAVVDLRYALLAGVVGHILTGYHHVVAPRQRRIGLRLGYGRVGVVAARAGDGELAHALDGDVALGVHLCYGGGAARPGHLAGLVGDDGAVAVQLPAAAVEEGLELVAVIDGAGHAADFQGGPGRLVVYGRLAVHIADGVIAGVHVGHVYRQIAHMAQLVVAQLAVLAQAEGRHGYEVAQLAVRAVVSVHEAVIGGGELGLGVEQLNIGVLAVDGQRRLGYLVLGGGRQGHGVGRLGHVRGDHVGPVGPAGHAVVVRPVRHIADIARGVVAVAGDAAADKGVVSLAVDVLQLVMSGVEGLHREGRSPVVAVAAVDGVSRRERGLRLALDYGHDAVGDVQQLAVGPGARVGPYHVPAGVYRLDRAVIAVGPGVLHGYRLSGRGHGRHAVRLAVIDVVGVGYVDERARCGPLDAALLDGLRRVGVYPQRQRQSALVIGLVHADDHGVLARGGGRVDRLYLVAAVVVVGNLGPGGAYLVAALVNHVEVVVAYPVAGGRGDDVVRVAVELAA